MFSFAQNKTKQHSFSAAFTIIQSSKPDILSPSQFHRNPPVQPRILPLLIYSHSATVITSLLVPRSSKHFQVLTHSFTHFSFFFKSFFAYTPLLYCLSFSNFLGTFCECVLMSIFLNLSFYYLSLPLGWKLVKCWNHILIIFVSKVLCLEPGTQQVLISCLLHTWLDGWMGG